MKFYIKLFLSLVILAGTVIIAWYYSDQFVAIPVKNIMEGCL
ncbi:hypothetical protein [Candidatus Harpocratesius sp.]